MMDVPLPTCSSLDGQSLELITSGREFRYLLRESAVFFLIQLGLSENAVYP